jgi:hypothetical protein
MDVRTSIVDLFVERLSAAGVHAEVTVEKVKQLLTNGVEIDEKALALFIEDCTDDNY